MSTVLTSYTSWYNPFVLNGRYVNRIIILKDGEEFRETNWFDFSNQEFKRVEFPFDTKVKRNIDLNSKVAFMVSNTDDILKEKEWDLYIPIELLDDVEIEEEKTRPMGKTDIWYETKMNFTLPIWEAKHPDKSWAPKTGRVSITARRVERSDYGKRVDKLKDVAKKAHVNLSGYDIEKLLDVFNITIKRNKKEGDD